MAIYQITSPCQPFIEILSGLTKHKPCVNFEQELTSYFEFAL